MVRAVEAEGHAVVWACDPMHGNTFTSEGGRKTGASTTSSPSCAPSSTSTATKGPGRADVHVELTGDDVTECLGGAEEIFEGTSMPATPRHATPG